MKKIIQISKKTFRKELGSAIKDMRQLKGISQEKLAESIESSQNRIPEIERGDTKNIDTYIACIVVLGAQMKIELSLPGK